MEMEMERKGTDMDSENHQAGSVLTGDTRGKHRILAELKRLEQETRSLELPRLSQTLKTNMRPVLKPGYRLQTGLHCDARLHCFCWLFYIYPSIGTNVGNKSS
ncbi:hypothetical protein MKX01_036108 [Papaver californicum]|nr:hypothetical protein MKX01_036108 [Papaver californicum]